MSTRQVGTSPSHSWKAASHILSLVIDLSISLLQCNMKCQKTKSLALCDNEDYAFALCPCGIKRPSPFST